MMELDAPLTLEVIDKDPSAAAPGLLGRLTLQTSDSLLALIGAYLGDPRADKIDLGVGVYRDEAGTTPVMGAVKAAERLLIERQTSKSYLGPEGDLRFFELLTPIVTGRKSFDGRLSGFQTPGGTGALRLATELIATADPEARVIVGTPTWVNHAPILKGARLQTVAYDYFDVATQSIRFDAMMDALGRGRAGDVVLLHGCCHNPTGADLDESQWAQVTETIVDRGLVPLIDLAYQGLGRGLDADAAGARMLLDGAPEVLLAFSCDKNFGLYRERTGALFVLSANAEQAGATQSNLLAVARANWSMPPDHGAAIVRTILDDDALAADWRAELEVMRNRIASIRATLAALDPALAALGQQRGMFSTLPLSPEQVDALRADHGVYMARSGRINVAGLTSANVGDFAAALATVR